jgi:hypothetical protein
MPFQGVWVCRIHLPQGDAVGLKLFALSGRLVNRIIFHGGKFIVIQL